MAVRTPGSITYCTALPPEPILDSSSIPTAIMISPPPSTGRTPARIDSFPACEAQAKITSAIGRNTRPVESGERSSTCCRYSELTNHIGKMAALNRRTIPLTARSCGVRAFGGTSGAGARRSTSGNRASSTFPIAIGTSAEAEPQPSDPAVTPP